MDNQNYGHNSEGQETGVIAPAPENMRKFFLGEWSIAPVKKKNNL
jgi:hypothetical protein